MSSLKDIMVMFIEGKEKQSTQLPRGLVLAYTPMTAGSTTDHRLVWSRRDAQPSETEDKVIESYFRAALDACGLEVIAVPTKSMQVQLRAGWGSSVMVIRTGLKQPQLMER